MVHMYNMCMETYVDIDLGITEEDFKVEVPQDWLL